METVGKAADHNYYIHLAGTSKCLDIPGGTLKVGQPLQLWECNGWNKAQLFHIFPRGSSSDLTYRIMGNWGGTDGPDLCVDVWHPANNGDQVRLWSCGHSDEYYHQYWVF
ncbi:ricin-type beta-trefoil lectin protein [Actinocrispum wychmicini]|uniref:Ricin-type beta-trefoil lectin protein n=1 Tax=Actinocrispum wychmicini TaxID=1213861 RepID=A0A4R2JRZ7_9PSEU|nr:ricin-type beta-trefoil lectin protein [Actinocrispum wychmicini]